MGCHFLIQGIFLTQELNPGLLHYRQILYQLSYKGNPRDERSQAIFLGSNSKTLIILSQGFWEDEEQHTGEATLTENLGKILQQKNLQEWADKGGKII